MSPPHDPNEQLVHTTTSLCPTCKNAIPARVVETASHEIWMQKTCSEHGPHHVRLSTNASWYRRTRAIQPRYTQPSVVKKQVEDGCPFDCGPCASHTQKVRLPVVTITSACNLDCPICYVHNKNDNAFHMGVDDFEQVLAHLQSDHGSELDIVNLTGGEPTVHPHFLDFLELAQRAGVHRVTICTNGLRLAKDEALVERIAQLGGRVALSFDSFETAADYALQGAHLVELKLRCLELLEKHAVDTTLIPVMTKGVNDMEIGKIIQFALAKRNVRHIEVHTMTFTGQSGKSFDRAGRISMFEVLERIQQTTAGLLHPEDFVPSPCAHPLCYQIAYLLVDPDGGPPIPFTRFMPTSDLYDALADRLYLEPSSRLEAALRDAIDRLWVEQEPDAERTLYLLKQLLLQMFPSDRSLSADEAMRVGERAIKALYVHSHMDEETFDTERAASCCDSNCYPDGSTIPVCNYNVLFREKERHFNLNPKRWNERTGGQKSFPSLPIVTG